MYTMFLNVAICISDVDSPREAYDRLCTILGRHEEIDFHTDTYITQDIDTPRDVTELYTSRPKNLLPAKEPTLADHAEAWWQEQGREVPKRHTDAWQVMYRKWHEYAFAGFAG